MESHLAVKRRYGLAPVIIAVLVVVVLVGIALYLYSEHHHNEYDQAGGYMSMKVTNKSNIPYQVQYNGDKYHLGPEDSMDISVAQFSPISATGYNYDGTPVRHIYRAVNRNATQLYLTHSGIEDEYSGKHVELVNSSTFPIMFIEQSPQGSRRWQTGVLPPHRMVEHFIGRGTVLQVSHPTAENEPIAQLTVNSNPSQIIFDGSTLESKF